MDQRELLDIELTEGQRDGLKLAKEFAAVWQTIREGVQQAEAEAVDRLKFVTELADELTLPSTGYRRCADGEYNIFRSPLIYLGKNYQGENIYVYAESPDLEEKEDPDSKLLYKFVFVAGVELSQRENRRMTLTEAVPSLSYFGETIGGQPVHGYLKNQEIIYESAEGYDPENFTSIGQIQNRKDASSAEAQKVIKTMSLIHKVIVNPELNPGAETLYPALLTRLNVDSASPVS